MQRPTSAEIVLALGGLLLGTASAGCASSTANLTLASTRPIEEAPAHVQLSQRRAVSGSDCAFWPLGIPLSFPSLERAIEAALDESRADLLVDITAKQVSYDVLVAASMCLEIEAAAVDLEAGP